MKRWKTKRRLKHVEAARVHAMKRLRERYSIRITEEEYAALNARVASVATTKACMFIMPIRGRTVHAVWNPKLVCIVTFLPREPHPRPRRVICLETAA